MEQLNFDQKTTTHVNGIAKESAADILADAAASKAGAVLAQPEVKAALADALNKVPPWLKVVLAIAAAIGVGPLLAAYVNMQALWALPSKYDTEIAAIKTEQAQQGEQLDRIEDAIDKLAAPKKAD